MKIIATLLLLALCGCAIAKRAEWMSLAINPDEQTVKITCRSGNTYATAVEFDGSVVVSCLGK